MQKTMRPGLRGSASLEIAADPHRIWTLVAEVTRMGRWSPETTRCEWIDGSAGPASGARFRGYNSLGPVRWSTTCTIETCTPGTEFSFVARHWTGALTRWSYRLERNADATTVTESYEAIHTPRWMLALEKAIGREGMLQRGISTTLKQLRAAAEKPA